MVVIQDHRSLPCSRINANELSGLHVLIAISDHIQLPVPDDAPVGVVCGWISLDFSQTIVLRVEKILPIVSSVLSTWGAPFHEEKLAGRRIVAW